MENDVQQPDRGPHHEVANAERNSPSSPVCYIDLSDYNTTPHTTLDNSSENHEDGATPGRTTPSASGDESDHTPRSEVPSTAQSPAPWNIASNSLQPQTAISDVEYFSSQPPPYLSNLPPSTSTDPAYAQTSHNSQASQAYNYLRSRPEFEIVTASHAQLEPSESKERPHIHRDASSTSTASASTIKANYGRIDFGNHPPPRDYRDYPQYPNQSYLALQSQSHPHTHTHQPSPLRTRGFQLSQQASYSASQVTTLSRFVTQEQYFDPSARTAGNTPAGSPGLFSPSTPPIQRTEEGGFYASPYLHHTQRQAPRETHVADVSVDSISGRKVINDYEVIDELGRGVHGKVKLGRNLATGQFIAIKIIDRNAKRRRLGKNDSHEEKIRREVAILKKVRHPNVVSLLEVIDDPKAKKVYLILEHVELGEVKWRKPGASEIIRVEYRRVLRESKGIFDNDAAAQEDQQIITRAARRREKVERQKWTELLHLRPNSPGVEHWSFEHGGASDEDVEKDAIYHALSRKEKDIPDEEKTIEASVPRNRKSTASLSSAQSSGHLEADTGLEGTMYGAYEAEIPRGRTPSVTGSSDPESTADDNLDDVPEHFQYVPLMTLAGARAAIRDTVLGLGYLHYQGVIHRDIKPANLLQTRDHRIKISDFGVSYLGRIPRDEGEGYQSESDAPDEDGANMDNPIELAKTVGTPAFFAPELCDIDPEAEAVPVTQAIDVWALGVTLFCLVFGRVPFYTDSISKWAIMPVIAQEEVYIPRKRLRALDDRSSSRPNSHGRNRSISSQKRSAHELEYEDVDDDLYDLLRRLLIKDPRKRITLKEVKRHPWVLADITNKVAWVDETEPERQMKGKRIELTHEDLNHAVIPINAFERFGSVVKKTLATVGNVIGSSLGRTGSSRKRAKSTAASEGGPPSTRSSSSTISQDARKVRDERRPSLRVDEFHAALRLSRDGDHPLSHSLTASPEARNHKQFFLGSHSRPHSPQTQIPEESTPPSKSAGNSRPYALNRAQSAMSTTTSIKTIRQSDFNNGLHAVSPEANNSPLPADNTSGSRFNGFISDARHRLRSYKSRDKFSKKLTEHSRERSVEKFLGREEDCHAEPSLAWSSAVAAGHVEQPLPLREHSPKQHTYPNSLMSTPSVVGADRLHPDSRHGTPSRQSSISSMSSRPYESALGYDERPVTRGSISNHSQQYESSDEQFKRAKEEQLRKLRLEESLNRERPKSVAGYGQFEQFSPGACPPSPDDDIFRQKIRNGVFDKGEPVQASFALGTSLSPTVDSRTVTSSSSEDQLASGISQSTSNPSIPSVKSQSSSIAPEDLAPLEAGKVSDASIYQNHPYDSEGYAGDHVVESEDDDEDSGDEDDFIVMTKHKSTTRVSPRSESVLNAELSRRRKNQSLGEVSQKSARSGSGGTLRKLRSHSTPEEDAPRGRAISPGT